MVGWQDGTRGASWDKRLGQHATTSIPALNFLPNHSLPIPNRLHQLRVTHLTVMHWATLATGPLCLVKVNCRPDARSNLACEAQSHIVSK